MTHFIHNINPRILAIGPIEIRWYGLFYVLSFILGYFLVKKNFKIKGIKIGDEDYTDFLFSLMLGVILGGRLGYILFYNLAYYLSNPLSIFYVWEGGMSFHGGALGVIIAGWYFCRKHKLSFYQLADPVMPIVTIGLFFGRLGNFINGELYGRETTVPWGMIFPNTDPAALVRHPSQLYEALFEGIIMGLFLQFLLIKTSTKGIVFWSFIGFYGVCRFVLEYFREPDNLDLYANGLLFNIFTMGQLLSLVMVIVSATFLIKLGLSKNVK